MDDGLEKRLIELTIKYDEILNKIEDLEKDKKEVRNTLIEAYNEAISVEFPFMEIPEIEPYIFYNNKNNKIYKKSISNIYKFDSNKFLKDNPDLEPLLDVSYKLNERRARDFCAQNSEGENILRKYSSESEKQIKIYRGTEPKADDL